MSKGTNTFGSVYNSKSISRLAHLGEFWGESRPEELRNFKPVQLLCMKILIAYYRQSEMIEVHPINNIYHLKENLRAGYFLQLPTQPIK